MCLEKVIETVILFLRSERVNIDGFTIDHVNN